MNSAKKRTQSEDRRLNHEETIIKWWAEENSTKQMKNGRDKNQKRGQYLYHNGFLLCLTELQFYMIV